MLKKIFPDYKSKQELRNEVAQLREKLSYTEGRLVAPLFIKAGGNIIEVRHSVKLTSHEALSDYHTSAKWLKQDVIRKLVDSLEPLIVWNVADELTTGGIVLTGSLHVRDMAE